jgi:hypothetical protein
VERERVFNVEAQRFGDFAEFNKSEKFKGKRLELAEEAEKSGGRCALRVVSASPLLRVEIERNDQVIFARRLRQ